MNDRRPSLNLLPMKRISFLPLSLVTAWLAAASAHAGNITVKGSDTLVVLAQKWAEAYMAKTPDTKIQVTGVLTGTSFALPKIGPPTSG